jgi:hypothetical protein
MTMTTPRYRMVVGGRELDLTMSDVLRRMRDVQPEPIRDHLVEIGDVEFPPKQVLATLTGWERQSFTTLEANRVLARLGFNCCRTGRYLDDQPPSLSDEARQPELSDVEARLSAAETALAVAQEAIASLRNRVAAMEAVRYWGI